MPVPEPLPPGPGSQAAQPGLCFLTGLQVTDAEGTQSRLASPGSC